METHVNCVTCGATLAGRRRRFCSSHYKNTDTNNRHQNYACQRTRGVRRKLELMLARGLRCESCGYDRNHAALAFHHVDPQDKRFELELRSLSNRRMSSLRLEAAKCVVLCANCHAEVHHPNCRLDLPIKAAARASVSPHAAPHSRSGQRDQQGRACP